MKQSETKAEKIMVRVAEVLLNIAAAGYPRRKTRNAMKEVEKLMREYAELKYPDNDKDSEEPNA